MPPKKNKSKKKTKPAYTTCSCNLCLDLDCDDMVACDDCDKWFHFECAGVNESIKEKSWKCQQCAKTAVPASTRKGNKIQNEMTSKKKSLSEPPPQKTLSLSSSRPNSMSSRQKAIALQKLEEEEKIKLNILERKFKILECSDAEGVSDDDLKKTDLETDSLEYTLHWAKKVQMMSEDRKKNVKSDKISISASDEERELINKLYPSNAQSTLLEQGATGPFKAHQHEQEIAFMVEAFKKYREQGLKSDRIEADFSEKPKFQTETNTHILGDQLSHPKPFEYQQRKVKFDQLLNPSNVHQQQMVSGQKFTTQPELIPHFQQPMDFDLRSRVQQPSTKIDSTNVQDVKNPTINVGYGQASNTNNQFPQTNYGLRTSGITNNHQPPMNNGFRSSYVPFDQQQPMNSGFNFSIDPNINSQQQQLGASNFQNSQYAQASGYVGYVGPLTQNHIAARHTHSKDLPTFHGHAEQWPMFLSALINSTEACGFSDGDNLGRLQRCLKGDALETVQSRLIHASSVPGIIETLNMVFGRPNLIIHKLLEKINKTPSPKAEDLNSVIKFAISVQNLCATIVSSRNLEYLRNPILIQSLTDKLPPQIQLNWAYFKHGAGNVDLSVLGNWLYQLAQVATDVVNPSSVKVSDNKDRKDRGHQNNSQPSNYVNAHSDDGEIRQFKCRGCNSDSKHPLDNCKKFKELSVEERWNFVKKHKLCGSCFGSHKFYKCSKKKKCGVGGCGYNHHILLHNASESKGIPSKQTVSTVLKTTADQQTSVANAHRTVSSSKLPDIFRIVPVNLSYNGKSVRIFAYFDDGSNLTSLEESVAKKLGTFGTREALCVKWSFGNREVLRDSRQLTITISGDYDDAEEYILNHVRTVKKLMLPTQSITKDWLAQYSHFDDIPVTTYENATPQMIIGLEYSKLMVSLDTKEGDWSQPLVCKTRLGWVVQGPNDASVCSRIQKYSLNICECQPSDDSLHQLVNDFFSIENLDVKVPDKMLESKDVARAKQILESTITKKGNRYEVGLLWKYDNIELPDSYYMAKRRLECVEAKMKKDPVLAQRMRTYIQEFIEKGYIRKLSNQEKNTKGPRTWYLPVFPVLNPKKPEKLRVVWDGAAKVNGKSLNSVLLTGPDLLEPLPDVLRRFREKQIAFTGDLKEMFHQIMVKEEDQDSQRFLWHDDPNNLEQEPDEYILLVDSFGLRCSPTTAQYVKNKNAMDFKNEYSEATEAIIKGHYVDDMLENTHTVAEAAQLIKNVQFIHSQGGFEMRNFVSNSKELLQIINGNSKYENKELEKDMNLALERVLGMYWNTKKDTFTYSLKFVKLNYSSEDFMPTKREILRTVMSIFDPLGFLAHFVVYAKILLQEIWRTRIGWDETVPITIKRKWILWLQQLAMVEEIHIPRLYSTKMSPEPANSIQLHLFVDASIEAYAAVAYFRIENESGIDSCIVGAKAKVAPIKPMSVPRLELQGGVLGTRLARSIIKSHHGLQIDKTIVWCDSKTVLSWIHSDIRRYSQFVTFRVAEILDLTSVEWRWIPSEENVADEATKSKKIAELKSSSRWFVGPEFLRNSDTDWVFELEPPKFETDEELRPLYSLSHLEVPLEEFINFKRFSNWQRLVRAVAYVLRFVYNLKTDNESRRLDVFSSEELMLAESLLYRKVQYDSFQEELVIIRHNETASIKQQKQFLKNSFIRTCSAYLDENGVMRIKGRIDAATSISDSTKRPIILDRHHYVTHLIVYFYHKKYKHLNHQTVLNEIKQKYWIPKLRVVLGTIRNNCQKCKNTAAVPKIPEMAPLPPARLAVYMRPFTHAGIDYFGPIMVVVGRNTQKRWGVLITCMTTRAVHLEVAHSLNTSSCIMAIENFIAHRGQPREFYSDNGTNFHGADNELKEEFKKLDQNRIKEEFTSAEMSWSFNPPKASHMGGSWERMIQIVKKCMDDVISIRHPTDEVLTNLLKLTMNILNSRPLTYVSLDSPMDEVLTPNHFLIGSSNGMKPLGDFTSTDALKNTWKTAQVMADKFWESFVSQYLPTLVKRPKWFKKVEPLKVDDIVLIADETFKRNTWPKGIVVETYKDKLGEVRSGRIRTDLGTFLTRPVSKLVVLDVRTEEKTDAIHNDVIVKRIETGSLNGEEDVVEKC